MADSLNPDELVSTSGERATLEAFLDLYRNEVVRKISGLSDADAQRRLVPSLTTVGGLVKHLRWVEVGWFHQVLGDGTGDNRRSHERASEFIVEPGESVEGLIDAYRSACAASRLLAAAVTLDHQFPHHRMGHVSTRWIYVHLIEETARHAGHLDILREQIDALGD